MEDGKADGMISPSCIGSYKTKSKKRPQSWEPIDGEYCSGVLKTQNKSDNGKKTKSTKRFDFGDLCHWERVRCPCISLPDLESWSCCGCCHHVCENERRSHRTYSRCSSPIWRKHSFTMCKASFQNRKKTCSETDLRKMKRSLRLLGFELSDFGLYSDGAQTSSRWRPRQLLPTFRTRVSDRSVSLESLREAIKTAWADNRLGESHRRLLAQAAYEEWYFRKEKELWEKREEQRVKNLEIKGKLQQDIQKKKEKSEEEFQKWLQKKKAKNKEKTKCPTKKQNHPLIMLVKSREEIEDAFLKWKKSKDKELEKKRKEKKKEQEKRKTLEKQKAEKKITAEKAFLQWKSKLEVNEKLKEEKIQKMKEKQEKIMKRIHQEEKENAISFQVWKDYKDRQMKQKKQQMREADIIARKERLEKMEERMYEADQAFENWLEKVCSRSHKQFCKMNSYQKTVPWIPA